MGKKVRELELEIEQLQQQLFAKQRVQSNLEAEVAVYHSKQNAIINALTEAQSSASRIIADAPMHCSETLRSQFEQRSPPQTPLSKTQTRAQA